MLTDSIRHILPTIAASLLMLTSCSQDSIEEQRIRGTYTYAANEYFDDGIECDVRIEGQHKFGFWGVSSESDLMLGFKFNDTFDFNDMVLHYHVSTEGKWSYQDSTLTLSVDSADVDCQFIDSNAKAYVEQTMVRYLRKYVRDNFIPEVQRRLLFVGADKACLDEVTDSTLVVSFPFNGRTMCLKRVDD